MKIDKINIPYEIEREVVDTGIFDWITDERKGLHCSNCGYDENDFLLNNPKLPRILCLRCLTLIFMKNAEIVA